MVHVPLDAGSTAYINPWPAAALDNSSVITPGSTTAWWFKVSIATIRFMRLVLNKMPPCTGSAPPLNPVRAPAGVTGTLWSWA